MFKQFILFLMVLSFQPNCYSFFEDQLLEKNKQEDFHSKKSDKKHLKTKRKSKSSKLALAAGAGALALVLGGGYYFLSGGNHGSAKPVAAGASDDPRPRADDVPDRQPVQELMADMIIPLPAQWHVMPWNDRVLRIKSVKQYNGWICGMMSLFNVTQINALFGDLMPIPGNALEIIQRFAVSPAYTSSKTLYKAFVNFVNDNIRFMYPRRGGLRENFDVEPCFFETMFPGGTVGCTGLDIAELARMVIPLDFNSVDGITDLMLDEGGLKSIINKEKLNTNILDIVPDREYFAHGSFYQLTHFDCVRNESNTLWSNTTGDYAKIDFSKEFGQNLFRNTLNDNYAGQKAKRTTRFILLFDSHYYVVVRIQTKEGPYVIIMDSENSDNTRINDCNAERLALSLLIEFLLS